MTRIAPIFLSFSLIAFAGAAAAASDAKQQAASDTKQQSQQQSTMSAKRLIGTDVVDAQGKDMGEIKEIVLDLHNGRVHAAVVEFGGFLGIGDKQYAFPVSELRPAKARDKLMLNVSKEKLKDQQGFDKDKWPTMSDDYWGRVGGKAGAGGTKAQAQKVNLQRASELIGKNVQNKDGQQVGEVSDILLSSDRANIQHILVKRDGGTEARVTPKQLSLGTGDKLVVDMPAGKAKPGSAAGGASGMSDKKDDKQARSGTQSGATGAQKSGSQASAPVSGTAGTKKSFSELDKDNDGALSQLEVAGEADAKANFEKLDKNNDMKLSRDEWESGQAASGGTKK